MRETMMIALLAVFACGKKEAEKQQVESPPAIGSGSGSGPVMKTLPPPIVVTGFQTPESVLVDGATDTYLVSNVNGTPFAVDDNGFISKLSPDGAIVELKWIDGASKDVELNAPKGMAITNDTLWVADITVVRKFDAKTGKPKGQVAIPGAAFLNDVAFDPMGGVYVSDTGVNDKFEGIGADAIYYVSKDDKVKKVIADKDLGRPNGLVYFVDDDALWCVTFGSGEIFRTTSAGGTRLDVAKLPTGQLDGIAVVQGKDVVVSSWEGKAVYRGTLGRDDWKAIVTDIEAPADLAVDVSRKRVVIPKFTANEVVIQPLE